MFERRSQNERNSIKMNQCHRLKKRANILKINEQFATESTFVGICPGKLMCESRITAFDCEISYSSGNALT
jgi:hypothetical protein